MGSTICEVSWRTEWSYVVPSRPMMMLCSQQIHLTVLSALLTFVSIALFNNRHFAVRIPKAHSTHRLPRDRLYWKHVLHMTNPFSRKASLVTSLKNRPHHQGWRKAFLYHFPQNLAGFGKVDSKSSKKWCKVEAENEPPSNFDVLLTVHLSMFISVINQLDAQNFVLQ